MRLTWTSKADFDKNLLSDGFAVMNLLHEFDSVSTTERKAWCHDRGLFFPRLARMQSTCRDIANRVANFLRIDGSLLTVTDPPKSALLGKLSILRIVQVWVSEDGDAPASISLTHHCQAFPQSIIRMAPIDFKRLYKGIDSQTQCMNMVLGKQSGTITDAHLETLLHPDEFALFSKDRVRHHGHFECLHPEPYETQKQRLWSYASDKGFSALWYSNKNELTILRKQKFAFSDEFIHTVIPLEAHTSLFLASEHSDQRPRGIKERPCGRWIAIEYDAATTRIGPNDSIWEMISVPTDISSVTKSKLQQELQRSATNNQAKVVSLTSSKRKAEGSKIRFELVLYGTGQKTNDQDLRDILVSQQIVQSAEVNTGDSELTLYARQDETRLQEHRHATELYSCIPAGSRLLLTIASGWRRQHVLKFPRIVDDKDDKENNHNEVSVPTLNSTSAVPALNTSSPDDSVSVMLPEHFRLGSLWKTFKVDGNNALEVVIDSSSIAASAIPMVHNDLEPVYAVCGTVLELRKGFKVSNLTVLPREGHFLILALLSFGLITIEDLAAANNARRDLPEPSTILSAVAFNESCKSLGETLTCFPEKVLDLLRLFHAAADDENLLVTPELKRDLKSNPFSASNLSTHQKAYKSAKRSAELVRVNGTPQQPFASKTMDENSTSVAVTLESVHRATLTKLFATDSDEPLAIDKLYASNLMSYIIQSHRGSCVVVEDWEIRTLQIQRSSSSSSSSSSLVWFAHFIGTARTNQRPIATIQEALQCLPPSLRPIYFHKMHPIKDDDVERGGGGGRQQQQQQQQQQQRLVFDSLEVAIQMEAVFWLERHFHTPHAHWYQRGPDEVQSMIEALNQLAKS
jgi:hypothetical protein